MHSVQDILPAAQRFVEDNEKKGYKGSVIFQRFVPALACGVCLQDKTLGGGSDNTLTIEISHGPKTQSLMVEILA